MNFLKKLFQKKEKTKEISFNELSPWLVKNIEFSLDSEVMDFKKAKLQLEEAIKNLETAKIKDKAGKRIESAVETNKKAYLTSLKSFQNKLEPPKNFDYSSIKEYINDFDEKLKALNKRTLRNYHITKTLIGEELESITKALRNLDAAVKKILQVADKHNLKALEEIHENLKSIDNAVIKNEENEKKVIELNKDKQKLLDKEKTISQEIEKLRKGKEFKEHTELNLEKERIGDKIKDLESSFLSKFSPLEHSLKKLLRNDKELIESPQDFFIKNPEEFKRTINILKEHIDTNKIVLKNQKKSLEQVSNLQEFLDIYKKDKKDLEKDLKIVIESINKNKFEEEIKKQTSKLTEIEHKLTETDQLLEKTKKESIKKLVTEIESNLHKLGYKIKIKNVALD
ncbi:MAG: hypothetical protein ABIJ18_02995 [archaeon]